LWMVSPADGSGWTGQVDDGFAGSFFGRYV
jgi:hypothetical protein